jgi:hypothetical protein
MIAVANKAANNATMPATYPFGVQAYLMFEPTTATTIANCNSFKKNCKGASHAV